MLLCFSQSFFCEHPHSSNIELLGAGLGPALRTTTFSVLREKLSLADYYFDFLKVVKRTQNYFVVAILSLCLVWII